MYLSLVIINTSKIPKEEDQYFLKNIYIYVFFIYSITSENNNLISYLNNNHIK